MVETYFCWSEVLVLGYAGQRPFGPLALKQEGPVGKNLWKASSTQFVQRGNSSDSLKHGSIEFKIEPFQKAPFSRKCRVLFYRECTHELHRCQRAQRSTRGGVCRFMVFLQRLPYPVLVHEMLTRVHREQKTCQLTRLYTNKRSSPVHG